MKNTTENIAQDSNDKGDLFILANKAGFKHEVKIDNPYDNYYFYVWMCELQKWIRDEHLIHIELRANMADATTGCYWIVIKALNGSGRTKTWMSESLKDYDSYFNNYEKALKVALVESLKIISMTQMSNNFPL